MKKITSLLAAALFALAAISPVAIIVAPVVAVVGCKSLQSEAKTIAALQTEIAATRIEWATYAVAQRTHNASLPAGSEQNAATLALSARERTVKDALDDYDEARAANIAALQRLPQGAKAPSQAPVIKAGNAYLATVKAQR